MTSGCHGYENKVSNCSEAKFGSSTTLSNEDFHNIIGITVTAKEKLNIKLENQLKLIRNEYKEIYYSRHLIVDSVTSMSIDSIIILRTVIILCVPAA